MLIRFLPNIKIHSGKSNVTKDPRGSSLCSWVHGSRITNLILRIQSYLQPLRSNEPSGRHNVLILRTLTDFQLSHFRARLFIPPIIFIQSGLVIIATRDIFFHRAAIYFFIAPRYFFHRDRDEKHIAIAMKNTSRRDEKNIAPR